MTIKSFLLLSFSLLRINSNWFLLLNLFSKLIKFFCSKLTFIFSLNSRTLYSSPLSKLYIIFILFKFSFIFFSFCFSFSFGIKMLESVSKLVNIISNFFFRLSSHNEKLNKFNFPPKIKVISWLGFSFSGLCI